MSSVFRHRQFLISVVKRNLIVQKPVMQFNTNNITKKCIRDTGHTIQLSLRPRPNVGAWTTNIEVGPYLSLDEVLEDMMFVSECWETDRILLCASKD